MPAGFRRLGLVRADLYDRVSDAKGKRTWEEILPEMFELWLARGSVDREIQPSGSGMVPGAVPLPTRDTLPPPSDEPEEP
jgi:hypothetical protein